MSTFAEIQSKIQPGLPSQEINLGDNRASLTLAQAELLVSQGVVFAGNDVISIKDLAGSIEELSTARIAALKSLGASHVMATGGVLSLSLDQINALAASDITVGSQYETMSAATSGDVLVGRGFGMGIGESIVALADGSYVVVFRAPTDEGVGRNIYAQHFDAYGKALGAVTRVSGTELTNESQATVARLADGGYVVVWSHSSTSIYAQRFDADGDALGGPTQLSTALRNYVPNVIGLTDGGYLITAYQNNGSGYALTSMRYDANGQPLGSLQSLTPVVDLYISPYEEGVKLADSVEMSDGRVMIIWSASDSGGRGLAAQIIDANGAKVGDAFFITTQTEMPQQMPSIASLADGRFAVTWISQSSEDAIAVQLFDGEGNKFGSEITINSSNLAQDPPKITALENGRYVITWAWFGQDNPNATSGQHGGVYSQIIDADGTKIGAVSLVNTTVVGDQFDPQIVALAGGGYVVVWSEHVDTSGDLYEINAQVFSADGSKVGQELEINANEANIQWFQKITALAGGGFAITWYDNNDGKYYTRTFQHDTEQATLNGTASAISALTVSEVAHLRELHIDTITISDGGGVTLSKAVAADLIDISGFQITGASGVVVGGTGAALDDFSVADIAKLKTLGVTGLDASDNKVTLSLDQAMAYVGAGITLASGDAATVEMTFLQLVTLDSNLAALAAFGMKIIDLLENEITLPLGGYRYLDSIGVRFAASDVLTLTDYKFNIVNLTVAQIAELAEWGITKIDTNVAETEPAVLSLAQVKAFAAGGISFAADELVHLSDSVTALSGLSAGDIADLATVGVSKVIAEQGFAITTAQFAAFAQHGVRIEVPANATVSIRDTGANFAALEAGQIAKLSIFGLTTLDATDNKVVLSTAAIKAYHLANARFSSEDRVLLGVTTASLSATSSDDLLRAKVFGTAAITTAESVLDLTVATAEKVRSADLPLDSDFIARLADTASNLLAASYADLSTYRPFGIDVIRLADTGSVIAGLSIANITALSNKGVSEVDVTNGAITLSLALAKEFAARQIVFDDADMVSVSALSATFIDPDAHDLNGLTAINIDRIDASDNTLTLTLAAARTYVNAGIGFTASDAVAVKMGYAEAQTLVKATGDALHSAGVDRIEVEMTAKELASLTFNQLKALVAAGVDGINDLTELVFNDVTYDLVNHTANYKPVITSNGGSSSASITLLENTKTVTTIRATDQNAGSKLTYSIIGGADKALFTIDTRTGALAFKAAPDFENPKDSGKNNAYDLIVQVSDGKLIDMQALQVTVKNVNEAPTPPTLSGTSVKENVAAGTLVGIFSSKDPEGKALTYKLTDTAGGLFKLSGTKLVTTKPIDFDKVQKDTVTINISDGINKVTKVFTITIADILETITGTAKGDVLKGGIGMDKILGLAGNDTLYGYAGSDILDGGDGNDLLVGGAGGDRLVGGNGTDTASYAGATAGVTASLTKSSINTGDAKGDTYSSIENITGSSYADKLTGDAKANVLDGGAGDDMLSAGAGNDRLIGGLGFDDLHGGAGSDRFVFRSAKELGTSKTATDTIFDFSQKEKDLIDFTAIDANLRKAGDHAFAFIGTAKFSNTAGELRYEKTKANTYVYGDIDGNGKADFVLHIDAALAFKAGDFLL
ncbi:hypothetical protein IB238_22520 [Rhizobium sp. ARZ01]|uniref:hypothetical protein n=1 Tax=Rhizobium sp. ARZ01 TaxID=2769313 RepID=UPI00177CE9F7|nr:hypothetical protein [Rhizobium sp. ARZ01]MBD9375397.1 hypothetical protein [Rhizobium sp. ARZ01]